MTNPTVVVVRFGESPEYLFAANATEEIEMREPEHRTESTTDVAATDGTPIDFRWPEGPTSALPAGLESQELTDRIERFAVQMQERNALTSSTGADKVVLIGLAAIVISLGLSLTLVT